MTKRPIATAKVYRSGWTPSKPWCADLIDLAGTYHKSYCYGFRTLRSLTNHLSAVGNITVERCKDMDS